MTRGSPPSASHLSFCFSTSLVTEHVEQPRAGARPREPAGVTHSSGIQRVAAGAAYGCESRGCRRALRTIAVSGEWPRARHTPARAAGAAGAAHGGGAQQAATRAPWSAVFVSDYGHSARPREPRGPGVAAHSGGARRTATGAAGPAVFMSGCGCTVAGAGGLGKRPHGLGVAVHSGGVCRAAGDSGGAVTVSRKRGRRWGKKLETKRFLPLISGIDG